MVLFRCAQLNRLRMNAGWTAALLPVVITLGACAGPSAASTQTASPTTSSPPPESVILRASHSCHLDGSAYGTLGDGGYTITMKGRPDGKTAGLDVTDMACVLRAVSVPDSVVSQMDSTRALDGMQKASWDKFAASWTYHPDNGLRIILTESK